MSWKWNYPNLFLLAFDKGMDIDKFIPFILNGTMGWDFDFLLKVFPK